MQNWLRRQNKFTRWTAIGTAASTATGMAATAVFIITLIGVFALRQRTLFGMTYPPVLDKIGETTMYIHDLRGKLRDNARSPIYIFTEPRVGYRMAKH